MRSVHTNAKCFREREATVIILVTSIRHCAECFAYIDTSLLHQMHKLCMVHYFIDAETELQSSNFPKIEVFWRYRKYTYI